MKTDTEKDIMEKERIIEDEANDDILIELEGGKSEK